MSAAFTPGPWLHSYRKGHDGMNRHEVHDADGETIATLAWYPVKVDANTTTTNRTQNAMLIAAAPDLLEKASFVLAMCESIGSFQNGVTDPTGSIDEGEVRAGELLNELRAAIAKATGAAA